MTLRLLLLLLLTLRLPLVAQRADTLVSIGSHTVKMMVYPQKNGVLLYPKPRTFTFLKYIPRTLGEVARESVSKRA